MRLKDDEFNLLHAMRLGNADSVRLSPGRRLALRRQFDRRGWTLNGRLTSHGERLLEREKRVESTVIPVPVVEVEVPEEEIEERQLEDDDIQGSAREGMVDST